MLWSSAETLERVRPHLSGALFSPATIANFQRISAHLPDAISSYYLECRLAPGAGRVDFSVCLLGSMGVHPFFRSRRTAPALPDHLRSHPVWERVQAFLGRWYDPAADLRDRIALVWLEFDRADDPGDGAPVPCVSFLMDPDFLRRGDAGRFTPHPSTRRYRPFADEALGDLLGDALSPALRAAIAACFSALPRGGAFFYLAAMLPRGRAVIKVNGSVPRRSLARYLRDVGWGGSMDALDAILAIHGGPRARFDLDLDGDRLSPKIGVEFFSGLPRDDAASRREVLDRLVGMGLCDPAKRDALLGWAGDAIVPFEGKPWPTRLRKTWYVKVVHAPSAPLEAKGYLGFTPGFSPPYEG
jgi:hypothetical protein